MIYIESNSINPYFNLALEEYVMTKMDKDQEYFILWQNEPTIVVGKHQNTIGEINLDYVKNNKIHVVRRLSGGGAVYHDLGNLNFTFVVNKKEKAEFDFKIFTKPIIDVLKKMGVKANPTGRNDLVIKDKKFSGNAQYIKKGRILHHGTLLFDSDMKELVKALNVSDVKIICKGIKSIRSRVTNIKEHLNKEYTLEDFKNNILACLYGNNIKKYDLTKDDYDSIDKIMNERYMTWEWNYGISPKFNIKKENKFPSGKIETYLYVEDGIIKSCRIYGDFFGNRNLEYIEDLLLNKKYIEEEIRHTLKDMHIHKHISGLNLEKFITCII
ncbi:MAG: lipoate--protein ligase [Anaeromicrobium sp.]|jgi:lipoate-protein ligase A|uniref:lipoate--protein ligase n=1 Tax=Anaeromicrobium sp. TaxID=1929132 RepID=UPI0025D6901E|nr:lipoate--protein ligase [Anaeromicrobium sp.]MCT4593926.1 lipoate--protein ligase [Anaeromicrobium sp.]